MRYALIVLMLSLPALGQESKPEAKGKDLGVVRFIELKHLGNDGSDRANRVVHLVNTLNLNKAHLHFDPVLNTLAIRAETEADAAKAEEMLRRFDVPSGATRTRQISLTVYMLEPTDEVSAAQRPPVELASTVEQIRNLFGHKQLRLVQTTLLQGREDAKVATTGMLEIATENRASTFSSNHNGARYVESQKAVHVNDFEFRVRGHEVDSHIHSHLMIRDGQKLVVGKVTRDKTVPGAYLVVTAKVD